MNDFCHLTAFSATVVFLSSCMGAWQPIARQFIGTKRKWWCPINLIQVPNVWWKISTGRGKSHLSAAGVTHHRRLHFELIDWPSLRCSDVDFHWWVDIDFSFCFMGSRLPFSECWIDLRNSLASFRKPPICGGSIARSIGHRHEPAVKCSLLLLFIGRRRIWENCFLWLRRLARFICPTKNGGKSS